MNSFKKISIATAAALAIMGVSVTSAVAAPLAVTVATVTNATTSAAPATIAVPSTNIIDAAHAVAIAATADTGTIITFTASSTVKLVAALNTTDAPKNVTSGVAGLTATSTGASVTVYAYTTSTEVGSVTIVNGAYSTIVYVKGIAGSAYNLAVVVPAAASVGTVPAISVKTTDAFGNASSDTLTATIVGSTFADGTSVKSISPDAGNVSLATGVAGDVTVIVTGLTLVAPVTGFAAPVKAAIAKFTIADYSAQIAALNSALATEKAGRAYDVFILQSRITDLVAKSTLDLAASAEKYKSDTATVKALADAEVVKVKAELDTVKADALNAKTTANNNLADALVKSAYDIATVKATAEIAAAAAAVTYKNEYNKLAAAWNKAHPKAKVALKK
jgi:hypothetical protein